MSPDKRPGHQSKRPAARAAGQAPQAPSKLVLPLTQIIFSDDAYDDLAYWIELNDRTILKRIHLLIKDTMRDPSSGLGKPEKLTGNLAGYASRRINNTHRMVYRVEERSLIVIQLRLHY